MRVINIPALELNEGVDDFGKARYFVNARKINRKEFLQWLKHIRSLCTEYLEEAKNTEIS